MEPETVDFVAAMQRLRDGECDVINTGGLFVMEYRGRPTIWPLFSRPIDFVATFEDVLAPWRCMTWDEAIAYKDRIYPGGGDDD